MMMNAARMRRWMLLSAPVMILTGTELHAGGGGTGLFFWLLLGIQMLPQSHYPYPRKRKGIYGRLFFSFSLLAFSSNLLYFLAHGLFPQYMLKRMLFYAGTLFFLLPPCSRLLLSHAKIRFCLGCGGIFLMLFFIFYR